MIKAQFETLVGLLTDIRDRLPEREPVQPPALRAVPMIGATREEKPVRPVQEPAAATLGQSVALGHRQALAVLLVVLDDWINGVHDNHEAMGHRGESTGSECWRQFAPDDIRRMVNDAAREVGIPEFPITINAREDSF